MHTPANPADTQAALDAYTLCLISLVLSPLALLPALIIILRHLPGSTQPVRSHYHYLLASLLQYLLVLAVVILCWRYTAAQQYFSQQHNIFPPLIIYPSLIIAPIAWWIWRLLQGYRLLKNAHGIANPYSPGKARSLGIRH